MARRRHGKGCDRARVCLQWIKDAIAFSPGVYLDPVTSRTREEVADATHRALLDSRRVIGSRKLYVWLAKGEDAAEAALLPPSYILHDPSMASYGFVQQAAADGEGAYIVAQAPYGPPLSLTRDEILRHIDCAEDAAYIVDAWLDAVHDALEALADATRAARAALVGVAAGARARVDPFVADVGDLWDDVGGDGHHSPADYEEVTLMLTGSWRAVRWFGAGPDVEFVLVRSDDLAAWISYRPGVTEDADVRALATAR